MNTANPENVPLDKIPSGWRLIYEEEYGTSIPVRVWNDGKTRNCFSGDIDPRPSFYEYTYITPCLPDNGLPWHAHKPGDPAPVEKGTWVDLVCRNGDVIPKQVGVWWDVTITGELDVLFYRLHDPATTKTESNPPPLTSDRILSILIAAGHITEEQVERARKLVKP